MIDISLYIDVVGEGKVPNGWYIRDRIKKQRLYYIRSGNGSFADAAGNRIPFEAGKIYIHPYNIKAEFESDTADPIDHIYFDFISAPPIIADTPLCYDLKIGSAAWYTVKSVEALLNEVGERITCIGHPHRIGPLTDPDHSGMFAALLKLLLTELSLTAPLPFTTDETVCRTLDYIRDRYSEQITVTALASEAGFEVNYFIRHFKKVMGMTPYAYLRSYRLLKAKTLISQGKSLAEAAALVGYENASSLSRALGSAKP